MVNLSKLYLRHAHFSDARQLLEWKNEETVRKFSIVTQDLISWENHVFWLKRCLDDVYRLLYVITDGERDYGDLRFDIDDENDGNVEVSIRLDKNFRGMGIGTHIIGLGCERVRPCIGKRAYVAKIVHGNEHSLRVFQKNGFVGVWSSGDVFLLRREK